MQNTYNNINQIFQDVEIESDEESLLDENEEIEEFKSEDSNNF